MTTSHQLLISCIECFNCIMISSSFSHWYGSNRHFIDFLRSVVSLDPAGFKLLDDFIALSLGVTTSDHYLSLACAQASYVVLLRIKLDHVMILEECLLELYIVQSSRQMIQLQCQDFDLPIIKWETIDAFKVCGQIVILFPCSH